MYFKNKYIFLLVIFSFFSIVNLQAEKIIMTSSLPAPQTVFNYLTSDNTSKTKHNEIKNLQLMIKSSLIPLPKLSAYSEKLKNFTKIVIKCKVTLYQQPKSIGNKQNIDSKKIDISTNETLIEFNKNIILNNDGKNNFKSSQNDIIKLGGNNMLFSVILKSIVYNSKNQWGVRLSIKKAKVRLSLKEKFVSYKFYQWENHNIEYDNIICGNKNFNVPSEK